MGLGFPPTDAQEMEAWYRTEPGMLALRLQMALMRPVLKPRCGKRLLDVGCGTGRHIELFRREGFHAVGLDSSKTALNLARERLGFKVGLFHGRAEKLPFHKDEYDIVTLIHTLEFLDNPQAALAEAFRVAKKQVFVGVLNSTSLTSIGHRVKGFFAHNPHNNPWRFSLWDLTGLMRSLDIPCNIRWATVGILPHGLGGRVPFFEADPLVQRNPFGSFLGVSATLAETAQITDLVKKIGRNHVHARPATTPTAMAPFHRDPQHRGCFDASVGRT